MIPQAFAAVASGRKSVALEEEHADAPGTGPSHFRGPVAEELVLDRDLITGLESLFGPELAAVARNVGEQDREAMAVGPTRDRFEVHMAPELSGDVV
jgi:hypothetical protein